MYELGLQCYPHEFPRAKPQRCDCTFAQVELIVMYLKGVKKPGVGATRMTAGGLKKYRFPFDTLFNRQLIKLDHSTP